MRSVTWSPKRSASARSKFRAAFDNSGLRLLDIAYNRGDKRLLPLLEKARTRFPRLDRFTTVSIYAVFGV